MILQPTLWVPPLSRPLALECLPVRPFPTFLLVLDVPQLLRVVSLQVTGSGGKNIAEVLLIRAIAAVASVLVSIRTVSLGRRWWRGSRFIICAVAICISMCALTEKWHTGLWGGGGL
jgi:hypothetical protein